MGTAVALAPQIDEYLESICEKLQLPPSKYKLAEDRYVTVAQWLGAEGSQLASFRPLIYPQGSFLIGTTTQPFGRKEFDLDFVCQLMADWRLFKSPLVLLDLLEARFKDHSKYKSMYERRNRCIALYYKDDFYMDILPACPDSEGGGTCIRVPDRKAKVWKASNPKGYGIWFESKAELPPHIVKGYIEPVPAQEDAEEKSPLKLAVQLLKRRRDIMFLNDCDNAPISIVLTTLAAQHYRQETSVNLALMGILTGITTTIQQVPPGGRLRVLNPSNTKEDLSERWEDNQEAWRAFVRFVTSFEQKWQRLNREHGIDAIAAVLEEMFGDEPIRTVVREKALAMQSKRETQQLSVKRSSGIIVGTGIVDSIRVPRNTFYGK